MLSMEPSIKRGLTFWDRALMPRDEFEQRLRNVRRLMRERGLVALIVSGNMYEDADLAYLIGTGVDGTLVVTLNDEPCIFTASGSRESFFLREQTWIADVSHRGYLVGAAVRETLVARGLTAGRIGTAGLQVLAKAPFDDLIGALVGYELQEAESLLRALRSRQRPRETAATRVALGIARAAADAARRVFEAGASNAAAAIEAERVARLQGAWDVRILANLDSDDLRPFERLSDDRRASLHLWVAARYQAYWADAIIDTSAGGRDDADAALAAMIASCCPGAIAGDIAQAGLAKLPEKARRSALAYGLGRRIGSELNADPVIEPESTAEIVEDMVLSFHIFARHDNGAAFAGAIVQVAGDGAHEIQPLARTVFGVRE